MDRLRFHGLVGHDRVLDCGCGIGQWSLALSSTNKHVLGFDISTPRIQAANRLKACMNIGNVEFSTESPQQNIPNESLDAIVCYSVLHLMKENHVLIVKNFSKMLKPEGKLYIMVSPLGWFVYAMYRALGSLRDMKNSWQDFRGFASMAFHTIYSKGKGRGLQYVSI